MLERYKKFSKVTPVLFLTTPSTAGSDPLDTCTLESMTLSVMSAASAEVAKKLERVR